MKFVRICKNFIKLSSLFIVLLVNCNSNKKYDVAVVGLMNFHCGLARLASTWIDSLYGDLKINFVNSRPNTHSIGLNDLSLNVIDVINQSQANCEANVSIFVDLLWDIRSNPTQNIPPSLIKIAYTMLESTTIPNEWVDILNNNFDAVVVPDKFLIPVYKSSGVNKPIFVLPISLYLKDFLNQPRQKSSSPFIFGSSASFIQRKNHDLLIEAFAKEFKDNKNFQLIIHGRSGDIRYINKLNTTIKKYKLSNVQIILEKLSQEKYINFMSKLNCYVLISRGEGFSITPYEALALGTPCILTNNTAQSVICNKGFVKGIDTPISVPAYYLPFNKKCGYQLTCSVSSVQKALRDVYNNYNHYLELAKNAQSWVQEYEISHLKQYYKTLVKPKKVFFGSVNHIGNNHITTSDENLYHKYNKLISLNT